MRLRLLSRWLTVFLDQHPDADPNQGYGPNYRRECDAEHRCDRQGQDQSDDHPPEQKAALIRVAQPLDQNAQWPREAARQQRGQDPARLRCGECSPELTLQPTKRALQRPP